MKEKNCVSEALTEALPKKKKYKIKTIESYCRFRGFTSSTNTHKITDKTGSGKLGREFFDLILLGKKKRSDAVTQFLKRIDEIE